MALIMSFSEEKYGISPLLVYKRLFTEHERRMAISEKNYSLMNRKNKKGK